MSDQDTIESTTAASSANGSPPAASDNGAASGDHMIPKARFDTVNVKRKEAEAKAAELAAELELARKSGQSGLQELESKLAEQTSRFKELESSLSKERRDRQALQIANELGIGEWAGDIRGDDFEGMVSHAKAIKDRLDQAIRSSTAGTPAPRGGRPAPAVDLDKLNDPNWVANNTKAALEMELARLAKGGS